MFLDRRRRSGPFLEWKVRIFVLGAALALGGMYMEERWMTGAAIAVLSIGIVLRAVSGDRRIEEDDDEELSDPTA